MKPVRKAADPAASGKLDPNTVILAADGQPVLYDRAKRSLGDGVSLTLGTVIDEAARAPNPPRIVNNGLANVAMPGDPYDMDEVVRRFGWISKCAAGAPFEADATDLTYLQELIAKGWYDIAVSGAAIQVLLNRPQWGRGA